MADNDQKSNDQTQQQKPAEQPVQQPQQPQLVVTDVQTQLRLEQQAIARAAQEAEEKQMDETEPGGRYLVNNVFVDAEGKPHKDQKTGR